MMKNWFYQIRFQDGSFKRREYVTKKLAQAAYDFCSHEMLLLNIVSVEFGEMK
jgi:hypothetical protein